MNEHQYMSLRSYLEEHSSQNKQMIGLLERQNELLNEIRLAGNRVDDRLREDIKDRLASELERMSTFGDFAASPPTDAIGSVTVETVVEQPLQTTETVEIKDAPKAAAKKGK